LHWIVEPFFVDAARHGWMAPFALAGMAGGLALFWALAFGLAGALARASRRGRVLYAVALLCGAEMLRGVVFTGFPWATIGHVWIGWPQMQLAAYGGAGSLTLVTLLAASLPALFGARKVALGLIAGATLGAAPGALETWRVPRDPAPLTPYVVRVVQPNAPQHLKWHPDHVIGFYERQLAFTAAPAQAGGRPDLVVWPEIALPFLYHTAEPAFAQVAEAAQGAEVALGLQRREADGRFYNMLLRLDGAGIVRATYDKHHLVPFGEVMPFGDLLERWGILGLAANVGGGFSPGPGPELMDFGPLGQALPLICYEAIFPGDLARAPDRADFLLHVTNDAWFGDVTGPYQHLAQARLRAVEQGLPVMRSANTGVSGGIDPYGRMLAEIALGEAGFVDVALPAPLPPTVYARHGDWPIWALLTVLAATAALVSRVGRIDEGGRSV